MVSLVGSWSRSLDKMCAQEYINTEDNPKRKASETEFQMDSITDVYIKNSQQVYLQYFKKSGKYYSSGQYVTDKTSYYEIIQEVSSMLQEGNLPDLVEGCSEFDVYIAPNEGGYFDQYFPIIIKL